MEDWTPGAKAKALTQPRHVWVKGTASLDFQGDDRPGLLLRRAKSSAGRWMGLVVFPNHFTPLMGCDGGFHVEWIDFTKLREV